MENSNKYRKMLSPIKIGNVIFKNRIITASHVVRQLNDGIPRPTEAYADHLVELAKGGAGCVVVGGASAYKKLEIGDTLDGEIGFFDIYGQEFKGHTKEMVDRIHSYGAKACMQCSFHSPYGYTCSPGITLLPLVNEPMSKGEMTREIMEMTADRYADAAAQAKEVGFDMIQLHMGSGGLLMQFLSRATNHRTDEFNGDLKNRAKFPLMVIDRIRSRMGDRILIEVKICCEEFVPDGIVLDEAIEFMGMLEDKVDLLYLTGGQHWTLEGLTKTMISTYDDSNPFVDWAKAIKKAGIKLPIELSGAYQDPDEIEQALDSGIADFVTIARGAIADPMMPNKTYRNEIEQIRPCIQCMHCQMGVGSMGFDCSVNPRVGREHLPEELIPAAANSEVAVIGGGPAGMLAALTAWRRGFEVNLFEGTEKLGGNTDYKETPFKAPLKKYINYLIHSVEQSDIKVHLNQTVTRDFLEEKQYNRVIVAIGSEQRVPPIKGATEHAWMIMDYYREKPKLKGNIVIVGGGTSGCEVAFHLAKQGCQVTILEMADGLGSFDKESGKQYGGLPFVFLKVKLDEMPDQIRPITGVVCKEIGENTVTYCKGENTKVIENVDAVIIATGQVSRTEEAMQLWRAGSITALAGDCIRIGTIEEATRTSYDAALNLP